MERDEDGRGVVTGGGDVADEPKAAVAEGTEEGVEIVAAGFHRLGGEGNAVPPENPHDRDKGEGEEDVGHGVQDVGGADEAAVEARETGNDHRRDERGGGQHPGGVAGVDGVEGVGRDKGVFWEHVLGDVSLDRGDLKQRTRARGGDCAPDAARDGGGKHRVGCVARGPRRRASFCRGEGARRGNQKQRLFASSDDTERHPFEPVREPRN